MLSYSLIASPNQFDYWAQFRNFSSTEVELENEIYTNFSLELEAKKPNTKFVFGLDFNFNERNDFKEWDFYAGIKKRFKEYYPYIKLAIQDKIENEKNNFDFGIAAGLEFYAWKSKTKWKLGIRVLSKEAKIFFNPEYYFGQIYAWTFVELSRTKDNEKTLFLQADLGLDFDQDIDPLVCFENIHYKKGGYYWRRIAIGLGLKFDHFLRFVNGKLKFLFVDEKDKWSIKSGYSVIIEVYSQKK